MNITKLMTLEFFLFLWYAGFLGSLYSGYEKWYLHVFYGFLAVLSFFVYFVAIPFVFKNAVATYRKNSSKRHAPEKTKDALRKERSS